MRTKRIISNSLIISSLSYLSIEFISILKSKAKLKGYFHTISELSTPIRKGYSGTITSFSPLSNVFNTILIINGIIYIKPILEFVYLVKTFFKIGSNGLKIINNILFVIIIDCRTE